ncbi:MAG: threonylcarbamoyl-AMP synthase [Deltaproteobacteria bacterium]|nr:threonylcarbamoyl-AMP synthase [Deltaproteobacteria bacterium]
MSLKQFTTNEAVSILKSGGVVAYPTETFYGLGVSAFDDKAVQKVFKLKGRDQKKPLSVLVADTGMLRMLVVEVPLMAQKLIEAFWPGPLTLVLPAKPGLPAHLTGEEGRVAVRVSSHPIAQAIVQGVGQPITTTSANISGRPSALSVQQVNDYFKEGLEGVVDGGELKGGASSTLVLVEGGAWSILREGRVGKNAISKLLQSEKGWEND